MSKKLGIDYQLKQLSLLAPAGHALGLHIRFGSPTLMFHTYPKSWSDIYTRNGYSLSDPNVIWGFSNEGTCRWSELPVADTKKILKHASDHGLRYGVAVAHGSSDSKSIGGFSRSDREFSDDEISDIQNVIKRLHSETRPPESLTEAQVDALKLIADGCRQSEAAAKLRISESALKARLKTARERLLARTTTEAIQRAVEHNLM